MPVTVHVVPSHWLTVHVFWLPVHLRSAWTPGPGVKLP